MNKASKVTKWTCDICKAATFDSYEEAIAHEKQCQKKLITVWTCDICKVREFTDYKQAIEHEKICRGKQAGKKYYVCDICKEAFFDSVDEAKKHEALCSKIHANKRNGATICKPVKYNIKDMTTKPTIHNNIREVTNMNELPNIKSTFQDKDKDVPSKISQRQVPKDTTEKNSTVYIDTTPEDDTTQKNSEQAQDSNRDVLMPSPIKLTQSKQLPGKVSTDGKAKNDGRARSREIDLSTTKDGKEDTTAIFFANQTAQSAKNTSSKIAAEMGKNNQSAIVLDGDDETPHVPKYMPQSLSFTSIPGKNENRVPILQPIISNNDTDDDSMLFSRLSSVHRIILSSLDLCEVQITTGNGNSTKSCSWITFRCTYCKYRFDKVWTRKSMGSELPLSAYAHLVSSCNCVPKEIKDELKKTNPIIPHDKDGKIDFKEFGERFCNKVGIEQMSVGYDGQHKFRLVLPAHSRLRAQNPILGQSQSDNNSSKANNSIEGDVRGQLHTVSASPTLDSTILSDATSSEISQPSTTRIPRGKRKTIPVTSPMFPLVLPDDDSMYRKLSPFNRAALTEIMFTINDDSNIAPTPSGYSRITLKCKHCGSSSRVAGLDAWHKTVYAMSYSHLAKTCHYIPQRIRKKILEGKKQLMGSNNYIGLKHYCDYVSQRYNFIDANKGNDGGIPGVAVKYSGPSYKEVDLSNQNGKRQRTSGKFNHDTDSNGNENYLSKHKHLSPFSNSGTSIAVNNPSDFNETNRTSDLIPRGAVPLTFSLTKKKSSKLNSFNKTIIQNFELCEQIKPKPESFQTDICIALRCQNCNTRPISFVKRLSKIETWHLDLIECCNHLKECRCTDTKVKKSLTEVYRSSDENANEMKEYCDFLVDLYGLVDKRQASDATITGITWGESQYAVADYSSKPEKVRRLRDSEMKGPNKDPPKRIPMHSLMLSPAESISTEDDKTPKVGITEVPMTPMIRPFILSDYNYLIASQLEFVILPKKLLSKTKSSSQDSQQIALFTDSDNNSDKQRVHIGAKCRHCGHTRRMPSISNFTSDRVREEFLHHFQHCKGTPKKKSFHLNECRSQHEIQKKWLGVTSIQEYLRKIMIDTYRMEDSNETGIENVIIRNENLSVAKNNCKEVVDNKEDGMLRLPLLIPRLAEPVSMDTKEIAELKSEVVENAEIEDGEDTINGSKPAGKETTESVANHEDIIELEMTDDDKMSIETSNDPQEDDSESAKDTEQTTNSNREDTSIASVESSSSSDDDWV